MWTMPDLGVYDALLEGEGGGGMSTPTLELRLKAFRLPSFLAHYARRSRTRPLGPVACRQRAGGGIGRRLVESSEGLYPEFR